MKKKKKQQPVYMREPSELLCDMFTEREEFQDPYEQDDDEEEDEDG